MKEVKASSSNVLEDTGPADMLDPVIEYGVILKSGSDDSENVRHSQHDRELHARQMVSQLDTQTVITGNSVDVPDQDVNIGGSVESGRNPVDVPPSGSCTKSGKVESGVNGTLRFGSCAKSGKEESGVNGALQSVCPRESTSVKDIITDGRSENEAIVGVSVDGTEFV